MQKGFWLAVLAVILSGCGGSGPSPSAVSGLVPVVPSPLPAARQRVVLTGRVAQLNSRSPAVGARVTLGRLSSCTGVSDASGSFTIALPAGATLASLLCNSPRVFSVTAPSVETCEISYQGGLYPASSVPLPADIVLGRRTDLGVVTVVASSNDGDGDAPPPPPSFAD